MYGWRQGVKMGGELKSQKVQPSFTTSCVATAAAQLVTAHFCRLFEKCLLLKVTEREGKEADRFF